VWGASNRTFDGADRTAQLNESLSLSFPWDSFCKSCAGSAPLTLNLMKVKTNQFRGFLSLIGSAWGRSVWDASKVSLRETLQPDTENWWKMNPKRSFHFGSSLSSQFSVRLRRFVRTNLQRLQTLAQPIPRNETRPNRIFYLCFVFHFFRLSAKRSLRLPHAVAKVWALLRPFGRPWNLPREEDSMGRRAQP
jgi:hypothetical protein